MFSPEQSGCDTKFVNDEERRMPYQNLCKSILETGNKKMKLELIMTPELPQILPYRLMLDVQRKNKFHIRGKKLLLTKKDSKTSHCLLLGGL